jgi:hypothetical protein
MRAMTDGPQHPREPEPGGYGYPHGGGYGYPQDDTPQQHSGPAWTPPSQGLGHAGGDGHRPDEPDWSALADQAQAGQRRRKLMLIGGGVLGAAAIAAAVAAVVITVNGRAQHEVPPSQAGPAPQPTVSFSNVTPPPAPNPLAIISDARKDTAPLSANGLFPGSQLTWQGRAYTKGATASTDTCYTATSGGLGNVLAANGCREVLRATYTRNGIAVTVGVAVFGTTAQADRAKEQSQGYVQPLAGSGVPTFCHATACQTSANAVGRYAYFTISGLTSRAAVSSGDPQVLQAGGDIAAFAFNEIVQRGRDEAASGI